MEGYIVNLNPRKEEKVKSIKSEERIKNLEHENMKLKLKILDCQLKERDYVQKINFL